jgi:hypothetical protein
MDFKELTGIYRGTVLATDASESIKSGRLKVEVPPYIVGKDTATTINSQTSVAIEGMSLDDIPWAVPATPLFYGASSSAGSISIPSVNSKVFVFFEGGNIFSPVYFANAIDGVAVIPSEAVSLNYPETTVLKTPNGITIVINDNTGDITITSKNDLTLNTDNDLKAVVSGDMIATVTGGIAIVAAGSTTVTGGGSISVQADEITLTGDTSINLN